MYHARDGKTTKKRLLICGQKNVETYSPSNAVALELEEEVLLKHPSKNKTRKKKEKELNRRILTDVE